MVSKQGDLPVYELRPERGNGRVRMLYRNLPFPCSFISDEEPEITTGQRRRTGNAKIGKQRRTPITPCPMNTRASSSDSIGSEDDYLHEYYPRPTPRIQITTSSNPEGGDLPGQTESTGSQERTSDSIEKDQNHPHPTSGNRSDAPDADKSEEDDDSNKTDNGNVGELQNKVAAGETQTADMEAEGEGLQSASDHPKLESENSQTRPSRQRHPPNIFAYQQMGTPDPSCMYMGTDQQYVPHNFAHHF